MKELIATIYQCSYCGKRYFVKEHCANHEEKSCFANGSPRNIAFQKLCPHVHFKQLWDYRDINNPIFKGLICSLCGAKHETKT